MTGEMIVSYKRLCLIRGRGAAGSRVTGKGIGGSWLDEHSMYRIVHTLKKNNSMGTTLHANYSDISDDR